jgi:hypothetical protein
MADECLVIFPASPLDLLDLCTLCPPRTKMTIGEACR